MLTTPEGFQPRFDLPEGANSGYCFVVHAGKLLVTRGHPPALPQSDAPVLASVESSATHYFGDYSGRPCRVIVVAAPGPSAARRGRFRTH